MNILLLCDNRHPANVVQDHIAAFSQYSRHHFIEFNPRQNRKPYGLTNASFDAIVIHYSLFVLGEHFLPPDIEKFVSGFDGLKVHFIQDEYRRINDMAAKIESLGIHVLFSALAAKNVARVYHHQGISDVIKYGTLPGFIPQELLDEEVAKINDRMLDVGYRARPIHFWLGSHGQQKQELVRGFREAASGAGLRIDISDIETERLYGQDWVDFVKSAKVMLGTEGGASVFDFTGEIQERVEKYVKDNPGATFDEVHELFLAEHDGNIVHGAITPRIFEAITLKTGLVLFPGTYRGVLKPWVHYIPLERDFSNIDQVISLIKDDAYLQSMVDRTYEDIVDSERYTMKRFIADFDLALDRAIGILAKHGPCKRKPRLPKLDLSYLRGAATRGAVRYCVERNIVGRAVARGNAPEPGVKMDLFLWLLLNPREVVSVVIEKRRRDGLGAVAKAAYSLLKRLRGRA